MHLPPEVRSGSIKGRDGERIQPLNPLIRGLLRFTVFGHLTAPWNDAIICYTAAPKEEIVTIVKRAIKSCIPFALLALIFITQPAGQAQGANAPADSNYSPASYYYFTAAQVLKKSGDLEAAAELYKRAIKLDPDSPLLSVDLGRLYMLSGNYAEALKYLQKAVEIDPKYADARIALAEYYLLSKDDAAPLSSTRPPLK